MVWVAISIDLLSIIVAIYPEIGIQCHRSFKANGLPSIFITRFDLLLPVENWHLAYLSTLPLINVTSEDLIALHTFDDDRIFGQLK